MQTSALKILDIVYAGFHRTAERLHLLVLLSLLYGFLATLLTGPSQAVIADVFGAISGTQDAEAPSPYMLLSNGFHYVLLAQVATLILNGALIMPWARAVAADDLIPFDDRQLFIKRGMRGFLHQLTAAVLSLVALMIAGAVTYLAASMFGQIAVVLSLAAFVFLIWFLIVISSVANLAVFYEAQDIPVAFSVMWAKIKPHAVKIGAALAVFWLIALLVNVIVNGVLSIATPYIGILIGSALTFAATSMHVAALSRIQL